MSYQRAGPGQPTGYSIKVSRQILITTGSCNFWLASNNI